MMLLQVVSVDIKQQHRQHDHGEWKHPGVGAVEKTGSEVSQSGPQPLPRGEVMREHTYHTHAQKECVN